MEYNLNIFDYYHIFKNNQFRGEFSAKSKDLSYSIKIID
jgi:hypothetical protein